MALSLQHKKIIIKSGGRGNDTQVWRIKKPLNTIGMHISTSERGFCQEGS